MFQEYMDKLVESVTTNEFSEEVINAKKEYFSKVGEIFEDDKYFENKMVSFTEWYCFDRILEKFQKTPLEYYIDKNKPIMKAEEMGIYNDFLKNVHSIFYIVKSKKSGIIVKDMCNSKKFSVSQNDSNLVFFKGDILEGRLIPFKERNYFSGPVCLHPVKLYRKIKRALKKKSGNQKEKLDFIALLSSMSLMLERSRMADYKNIYRFQI